MFWGLHSKYLLNIFTLCNCSKGFIFWGLHSKYLLNTFILSNYLENSLSEGFYTNPSWTFGTQTITLEFIESGGFNLSNHLDICPFETLSITIILRPLF